MQYSSPDVRPYRYNRGGWGDSEGWGRRGRLRASKNSLHQRSSLAISLFGKALITNIPTATRCYATICFDDLTLRDNFSAAAKILSGAESCKNPVKLEINSSAFPKTLLELRKSQPPTHDEHTITPVNRTTFPLSVEPTLMARRRHQAEKVRCVSVPGYRVASCPGQLWRAAASSPPHLARGC